jgi:hypothetical protein
MRNSPAPLPALLPDYEREKLDAEMLLNKAAFAGCVPSIASVAAMKIAPDWSLPRAE